MLFLFGVWQKYAWGKPGDQSVVASLKAAGDKSYEVAADEPYAEMWIGTHPSGPSSLLTNSGNVGPLLKVLAYETSIARFARLSLGKYSTPFFMSLLLLASFHYLVR